LSIPLLAPVLPDLKSHILQIFVELWTYASIMHILERFPNFFSVLERLGCVCTLDSRIVLTDRFSEWGHTMLRMVTVCLSDSMWVTFDAGSMLF